MIDDQFERQNYGLLINKDIKLHRKWFKEMVRLHGIICNYYAVKFKEFDTHGEINKPGDSHFFPPERIGVIFTEYPDQKTMKKLGWVAELQEGTSIISVPFDLPNLQVGCIFEIPSALENAPARKFRVINMSTVMIYPASVTCEIALEYETTDDKVSSVNFKGRNFTLLKENEGDD